jgi:hypothetical protein
MVYNTGQSKSCVSWGWSLSLFVPNKKCMISMNYIYIYSRCLKKHCGFAHSVPVPGTAWVQKNCRQVLWSRLWNAGHTGGGDYKGSRWPEICVVKWSMNEGMIHLVNSYNNRYNRNRYSTVTSPISSTICYSINIYLTIQYVTSQSMTFLVIIVQRVKTLRPF